MRIRWIHLALGLLLAMPAVDAAAQLEPPYADFLFIGSYHMGNPGRDVHNTRADDVLAERRQAEIADVVRRLAAFRPTRVMVEAEVGRQEEIGKRYTDSCKGERPLTRNEVEQIGFRVACKVGLATVHAVDWNELGPIKDEASIDYLKAVERHHQQDQYARNLEIGRKVKEKDQQVLDNGSVLDMLKRLNSDEWLAQNARAYYRIGLLGTPADPVGANWVQLWFGRNLAIFNNIARLTKPNDRVLVVYGAGHGNLLRQLAADSGIYRVHDTLKWLSAEPAERPSPGAQTGTP
jgi:hypothetical protein